MVGLDEQQMQTAMVEQRRLPTRAQHTYVYARSLLTATMTSIPNASNLKRVIQEFELAANEMGHDVLRTELQFETGDIPTELVDSCANLMRTRSLLPGDIDVVYRLLSSSDRLSVQVLRAPLLLDTLLQGLYSTDKHVTVSSPEFEKAAYILAYIVASPTHEEEANDDGGEELHETYTAIKKTATVCQETALSHSSVMVLYENIKFPIVSLGLLLWVNQVLADELYFVDRNVSSVPAHITLFDEIAGVHSLLRPHLLVSLKDLYRRAYQLTAQDQLEARRMVINRLVFLMSVGHVLPVLDFMLESIATTDVSLSTYFINEVLSMITTPISSQFATTFLKLIGHEYILPSLKKKTANHLELQAFFSACQTCDLDQDIMEQVGSYISLFEA